MLKDVRYEVQLERVLLLQTLLDGNNSLVCLQFRPLSSFASSLVMETQDDGVCPAAGRCSGGRGQVRVMVTTSEHQQRPRFTTPAFAKARPIPQQGG